MIERLANDAKYSPIELAIHLGRYHVAASFTKGKRVLDVGCGEGFGAYILSEKYGAISVDAVDNSKEAIDAARKQFNSSKIKFHHCDACELSELSSEKFDVVVACETIEHLKDPELFLNQILRFTHEQSIIVITCPNDAYYFGKGKTLNQFHKRAYSFAEFQNLTTKILGEAAWFLGAPANGFGIFPFEPEGNRHSEVNSERTYGYCSKAVQSGALQTVPSDEKNELLPDNSLFYVGVWGANDSEIGDKGFATLFSAESDFRLGAISNVGPKVRGGRPKLALVVDMEGWAYHNIANNICEHLSERYDAKIFFAKNYLDNTNDLFFELFWNFNPDIIHFFWRDNIFNFLKNPRRIHRMLVERGLDPVDFSKRFSKVAISTTVYDHLHSDAESIEARIKPLALIDAYSVSSPFLWEIYENGFPFPPVQMTEDGVSLKEFQPKNLERFENIERPLVIGWAGNSEWGKRFADDPKGFHSIVIPVMEELKRNGFHLKGHFADRNVEWRPREKMAEYYSEIDVLICASLHEGTPNPVLEAMACGVPFISTDVGIVTLAAGKKQAEFVMRERSSNELKRLLQALYNDRNLLGELSRENLKSVRNWDWKMKMTKWLSLFQAAEKRQAEQECFKYSTMLQNLENMATITQSDVANSRLLKRIKKQAQKIERQQTTIKNQAQRIERQQSAIKKQAQRIERQQTTIKNQAQKIERKQSANKNQRSISNQSSTLPAKNRYSESDQPPVHFIILMPWGRVGSNLAFNIIGQTKKFELANEPLTGIKSRNKNASKEELTQLQSEWFSTFFDELIANGKSGGTKLSVASVSDLGSFVEGLKARELRMIYMDRRNVVKTAISVLKAEVYAQKHQEKYGNSTWAVRPGREIKEKATIDIERLHTTIKTCESNQSLMKRISGEIAGLEIFYEDLLHNLDAQIIRLLKYLDCEAFKYNVPFVKAVNNDLSTEIENFEQVIDSLKNDEFKQMLLEK